MIKIIKESYNKPDDPIFKETFKTLKLKKNKNSKNKKYLEDALLTSIAGISAAMKNTG